MWAAFSLFNPLSLPLNLSDQVAFSNITAEIPETFQLSHDRATCIFLHLSEKPHLQFQTCDFSSDQLVKNLINGRKTSQQSHGKKSLVI